MTPIQKLISILTTRACELELNLEAIPLNTATVMTLYRVERLRARIKELKSVIRIAKEIEDD